MPWKQATPINLHWWEDESIAGGISEAILEVQFPSSSRKKFLVLQVLRVSNTFETPSQLSVDTEYRKVAEAKVEKEPKEVKKVEEAKEETKEPEEKPKMTRPPGYRG